MTKARRRRRPLTPERPSPEPPTPDSGAVRRRDGPERRCIVSGRSRPAEGLIRFVVGPDGTIVPDLAGKLPGRGIWVGAERAALQTAVDKRLFARAARQAVTVPTDLVAQVESRLAESCLGLLGLARRAGEAVTGFDKVVEAIEGGKAALVLAARDGAADGRRKIAGKAGRFGGLPVVALFDSGELSLALGRENVIHAALRPGGLATRFQQECARLAGFRIPGPDATATS